MHDILPKGYNDPFSIKRRDDDFSTIPSIAKDDTVRLQFTAYNTTFHLHLEPNLDLIHPEADLGGYNISNDDIMAFKGIVVQDEHHSNRKWDRAASTSKALKHTVEHMLHEDGVIGWARMMVEHDSDNKNSLVLRGAFMANGDTFHVTTLQSYHIQKRSDDALPQTSQVIGSNLVIYRDSDLYTPSNNLRRKRNNVLEEESSCGVGPHLYQNKTDAPITHEYYHPPNLTSSILIREGSDLSSSWNTLWNREPLVKRQVAVKVAGPNPVPDGCPTNRLVNYMGVAADCTYVRSYGGAVNARKQILADFNTASAIYESTFNVALGVIALNIVPDGCPTTPVKNQEWNQDCSQTYSIDQRLSDFSNWRGLANRPNDGAGLWHLMTKCNSGAVVGIAWTKALCQTKSQKQVTNGLTQTTAGTGVSSITTNEWMVVAHEVGHGFGAIHDCNQQTCAGGGPAANQCCPLSTATCDAGARFIMNPSESVATKLFSPCSIKAICSTIASPSGKCLKPPGTRSTQDSESNICGNGIKEAGEDCDCGSPDDCAKDPCCNGATCKFKAGAVCDDLNDSCCQNCQLRPAGQVCRAAISECDTQEVCSGTNATCPPDQFLPNQTPCKGTGNMTGLQCANGYCTSRDLQCQQQDRPGVTKQCGAASNSCDLTCNDPSGSSLTCTQIPNTFFSDGTPCGVGGTCQQGNCQYTEGVNGVLNWAKNHLTIVIPVASIIGLLLLCCIWSCCCAGCIDARRQRHLASKPQRLGSTGYMYDGFTPPQGNPPPLSQEYPMGPMGTMAQPPPVYQPSTGFTNHPNDSGSINNPFGNHNAQNPASNQQQRPLPGGYI
ncbi:hypothetical protein BGZ46_003721 [Entomortierella lignicola]|nr:hypothetical protein BGZ46_003721 [Entomortierella lignicola]